MRINFTARHYKSSRRLKQYAENEIKRLEKFFDGIINCDVVLDFQKEMQIAELKVTVYGQVLTVIEKTEDIYKSIDYAAIKMERQLKRYKQKKMYKHIDKSLVT